MAKEKLTEDEKIIKIKKDVIKNIAIVFLAIMLVLTFFSNSIMNKSLPEVATMYVESKSIQESIRGTGTVEIDDPYSVEIHESRTISSVAVKTGDVVEKDQVLFYLEDSESSELMEAQKALEDLIYKYTVGALTGEMSAGAYANATAGKVDSMASYEMKIEAAKARVKAAEDTVESIARQQAIASGVKSDGNEVELAELKAELVKAQDALSEAQKNYDEAKSEADSNAVSQSVILNAQADYDLAVSKYNGRINEVKSAINGDSGFAATLVNLKSNYPGKYDAVTTQLELVDMAIKDGNLINASVLNDWADSSADAVREDNQKLVASVVAAYSDANDKKAELDSAKTKKATYDANVSKLNGLQSKVTAAKNTVNEIQTKIDYYDTEALSDSQSNQELQNALAIKKLDADAELAKAKEAQTQLLTDISLTLDLANQNSIIKEQQEKVNKLKEKATGATIVAPVAGTILNISKVAGEETKPDEALATILVEGKASTMSFTVSNEQAKKVTIGDEATLQNAWYYDDIHVRLARIANDTENPGKNKKLIFSVSGEVVNGQSLSVSIGQKARDYEKVVPNSAVREDNKGKFILIISEKSTPFGNRYVAKRVDVEVLASDDTNTAVSGDLDSWAYVITTSDKPLSSGTQVRLADN